MYLRTPKRYKGRGRRRRGISLSRLLLWILAPVLIVIGVGIYENREMFTDDVNRIMDNVVQDVGDGLDNMNQAPPTATPDPTNDRERALGAWRRGAIQEAVTTYQQIINLTPNDIVVHFQLAYGLVMSGRFDDALTAAENAITADPFSPHGWTIRAMALNRLGRYGEAVASADQALSLIPDDNGEWASARARALAFKAEAYLNLELGESAEVTVANAIAADPNSAEAYYVRGQVNQLYNFDFDAARSDYEEAYTLNPNLLYTGIWLARLEGTSTFNNYDRSLEIYQSIAEQNPGNPQVLYDLGNYYYRVEGSYEKALEQFTRCTEEVPDYAPCQWFRGRTLVVQEQQSIGLDSLQAAVRLDPDEPYYLWWLGRAYSDLGQCPQASSYIEQGLRIAEEQGNEGLVSDYQALAGDCGILTIAGPSEPEETPEATPEAENTGSV